MNAAKFMKRHVETALLSDWGVRDARFLDSVVAKWLEDEHNPNSEHFFGVLESYLPGPKRVLDMASGCGNGVLYGLLHGHDCWGIDPEEWKLELVRRKIEEREYPSGWMERFVAGYGESLPFPDASFDCVTSWQTLEHVGDPAACIAEMVRVTRPGGLIYIHCPDYRSTFESHYLLPWFPLLPKPLARRYLKALDRPAQGLAGIHYITPRKVRSWVAKAAEEQGRELRVVNMRRASFRKGLERRGLGFLAFTYPLRWAQLYAISTFRVEMSVELLVQA